MRGGGKKISKNGASLLHEPMRKSQLSQGEKRNLKCRQGSMDGVCWLFFLLGK
jgi:hypothetical protein